MLRGCDAKEGDDGDEDELDEEESLEAGSQNSGKSPNPADPGSANTGAGAKWHAKIMLDNFTHTKDAPGGKIKACRGMPMINVSEFLAGLENANGRWLFRGPLNGWAGLVNLELKSLTKKVSSLGGISVKRMWNACSGNALPDKSVFGKSVRATFEAPAWTQSGYVDGSKGFMWWFTPVSLQGLLHEGKKLAKPGILCGEQSITEMEKVGGSCAEARAVWCHAFAHRYPVEKETLSDRQTYHTGVLVEWDHGRFMTVVELAYLYGCSGYKGRSNWCEDKLKTPTELFQAMPDGMKVPYDTSRAEIRAYDVPLNSREKFEEYLARYSPSGQCPASEQRFWDPKVYASSAVKLRLSSRTHLAGYLLNYVGHCSVYDKFTANCQTFAADLYGFLSGDGAAKPFGMIVKARYSPKTHLFLYAPQPEDEQ